MKKLVVLFGALVLMLGCKQSESKSENIVATTIEDMLSNPGEFEGKEVAVTGMVTHVCRHGGQKCFVLAEDGETQLRINVGQNIDEFDVAMEGSTVEFTGIFKILDDTETTELQEDHESKAHHENPMAHSEAEKASYFIEAAAYKEITN